MHPCQGLVNDRVGLLQASGAIANIALCSVEALFDRQQLLAMQRIGIDALQKAAWPLFALGLGFALADLRARCRVYLSPR